MADGDCFMTMDVKIRVGCYLLGASGGVAEGAEMGGGVDEDVRMSVGMSVTVLVVVCYLDELVADVETYGKKDHGGEECDCVHSGIFFNC